MGTALSTATLQSFLNRHGAEPQLEVDHMMGPHTAAALHHFMEVLPQRPIYPLGQVMSWDDFEGLDSPPDWPGAESGVTIGIGYDLGYEKNFAEDWGQKLEPEVFAHLSKVIGLKGEEARQALKELPHITISDQDAIAVFHDRTVPRYSNLVSLMYPGFSLMAPEAQTALFSLVYNRGASLDGGDRIQMRAMRPMVLTHDYVGMSAELLKMIGIWEASPIAKDMERRRTAESDLCLLSYFRRELDQRQANEAEHGERAVGNNGAA